MHPSGIAELLKPERWYSAQGGARYQQLAALLLGAIADGRIAPGAQLPPERDIASLTGVSRVTVRKAMGVLAERGAIEQRQGAGSFVLGTNPAPRLDQSLSSLSSFTEYMERRGLTSTSRILERGIYAPTPEESLALGVGAGDRIARIKRLRFADDQPLAIETSSLPLDILDDPEQVTRSLYSVLKARGTAPTRAMQRLAAANLKPAEAESLDMPAGQAVLVIERTGYLPSGRPVEWTSGLYRSDVYNFVAELRVDGGIGS